MAGASARDNASSVASRLAAALAAVLLSVGPLGLLQVVAWTGMAFDYSARYGWAEGIERTFDGKNPCSLCKEITKARQTEKPSEASLTLSPVKLVCVLAASAEVSPACAPDGEQTYHRAVFLFAGRTDRPAFPPPRTLAV